MRQNVKEKAQTKLRSLRLELSADVDAQSFGNVLAEHKIRIVEFGPMLQSVLMGAIEPEYAERLHSMTLNPYSQYCIADVAGNPIWIINALNEEAAKQIIEPLSDVKEFWINKLGIKFTVKQSKITVLGLKELTELIHGCNQEKLTLKFLTPTAFKSGGSYQFMPSPRLVFQNLLMRYCQLYDGSSEVDSETLSYIEQHVRITSYNLRSSYFHLGGVSSGGIGSKSGVKDLKIPAFVGSVIMSINVPQSLTGLINMLCRFAEFGGVGIKTSMGMGGAVLVEYRPARSSVQVEERG
jgi:CRISPR-associated endoribonuclease Cas6